MELAVRRNSINNPISVIAFQSLLNIYRLFNSDHASQGKEAASFHFNFLLPRFPSLNYKAIFVHKKEKIRIT